MRRKQLFLCIIQVRYVNLDKRKYVEIEPRYFRPTEVHELRADSSKARKELDWVPKITFKDLVKIMVDADLDLAGLDSPGGGKKIIHEKGLKWHSFQKTDD